MSFEKDLFLIIFVILSSCFYFFSILQFKMFIKKQREYFINTLGHDFRVSVIARIRALELIRSNFSPEILEEIKSASENDLDMITTLMETYKLENDKNILSQGVVELSNIINKLILKLEPLIKEKSVNIYTESNLFYAYADKYYITKALMLLFAVVISRSKSGTNILISKIKNNNKLEISVSYTGIPLSDEELSRMNEKSSCFSTVGHGMKMYLFKKIIDSHNGYIKIKRYKDKNILMFSLNDFCAKKVLQSQKPLLSQLWKNVVKI